MQLHPRELNELTRKAGELLSDTGDVPRLLKMRLGTGHALAAAAEEMLGSIEDLLRELRSFDASAYEDDGDPHDEV
ncbi:MAG TPA: hypothetical protein VMB25_05080 [Bryobacteraceae bacterium]|nr:hypothetical protein [Bryobacteraceae bacterium]